MTAPFVLVNHAEEESALKKDKADSDANAQKAFQVGESSSRVSTSRFMLLASPHRDQLRSGRQHVHKAPTLFERWNLCW